MMGRHGRNVRQRVADAKALEAMRAKAQARRRQAELDMLIEMREKLREAEEFNREIARIVGRTSVLAGAPVHQMFESMTREAARERGIKVPSPPSYKAYFDVGLEGHELEQVRAEVLAMLDYEVVRDKMKAAMHMRVTLAGKEVRYTISQQALRTLDREELSRRLVHELLVGLAPMIGR